MSFITKSEKFDEIIKKWNLDFKVSSYEQAGKVIGPSLFLAEEGYTLYPDKKRVVRLDDALAAAFMEIAILKESVAQKDSKIKELEEHINQSWDVMSQRIANIEKNFQNKNFPKNGLSPWLLEKARRIYFDETDDPKIHPNKFPSWDELSFDTQLEYVKRARK